jgi:kynurenine formamidase
MTTTQQLLEAIAGGVVVYDLARPMVVGMPQSPNHPKFSLTMPRRHGDMVRSDGGSAANDMLVMGTHVGTHIDALGHVSHDGVLHGGASAEEAQASGRLASHGIDEFPPTVCRGILLDVPAALATDELPAGYEITISDLEETVAAQGTTPAAGDVVLVRSGWGRHWDEGMAYLGLETGVPGVSEEGAKWLASQGVTAAGADTIAFEMLAPGAGHSRLPAHRVLLVESGIHIIETLDLEGIAAAGVREFMFVVAPLPLVGATGSPVRPLAVVGATP